MDLGTIEHTYQPRAVTVIDGEIPGPHLMKRSLTRREALKKNGNGIPHFPPRKEKNYPGWVPGTL